MRHRPRRMSALRALLLVTCGLAFSALADTHSPAERAIHYRHALYHVIEWNVAAMADTVKGRAPYEAPKFAMHATRVANLVPMLLEGFPPGSYIPGKTQAKESIWTDRATFEELLRKLGTRSTTLATVAAGGDLNAIKPAFNDLVQTCDECHKKFKEKGEH